MKRAFILFFLACCFVFWGCGGGNRSINSDFPQSVENELEVEMVEESVQEDETGVNESGGEQPPPPEGE